MHIDRHDDANHQFMLANFERLVGILESEAVSHQGRAGSGRITARIAELALADKIDTDEPPRSWLAAESVGHVIIRPLFDVPEALIRKAAQELKLSTEPSGCGHGATFDTQTPRQMVHWRVLNKATTSFSRDVHEIVKLGIGDDGWGRIGARRRRQELLGVDYKPSAEGYEKL